MIGDDSYYDNHTFINLFQTEDDKQQEELMILKFITTEFRAPAIRPIAFHPGILRPKLCRPRKFAQYSSIKMCL